MTVTTVVATTVHVRLAVGAPEAALCFMLSWPGGQACLTLDCPGVATVLGEGDGVLAALQEWQAALDALSTHLSPAPPAPPVSPPAGLPLAAPVTPLVEAPALAALAMTPAQVDGLAARWGQAQAAAAAGQRPAAGEART